MIVRTLKLHPFGGLVDTEVSFEDGLNVVLGPNEAGKSTLVRALSSALFTPSKLGKRMFKERVARFLPISGGDTVNVSLAFEANGGAYHLDKSWGKSPASRLTLPDGGILTDPEAVRTQVAGLLVANEAAYDHVLISYQSAAGTALDAVSPEAEPLQDLNAILRKAVFETDGVSVDRLGKAVQERYEVYFSRWNRELNGPEGNRGVENPWVKSVGTILAAYYEKEGLKRRLKAAVEYETTLDALNAKILEATEKTAAAKTFLDENRSVVEDAQKRAVIEVRQKALGDEVKRLKELSQVWPMAIQDEKNKQEALSGMQQRLTVLQNELEHAKAYEAELNKLNVFKRAKQKKAELEENRDLLKKMTVVQKEDCDTLETLDKTISKLKTSKKAGKLKLSFKPEKAVRLTISRDFEAKTDHELAPGQTFDAEAGGALTIRHEDWTLDVQSGERDLKALQSKLVAVEGDFRDLLQRLGVKDLPETKAAYEAYRTQRSKTDALQAQFAEILGPERYEDLEALAATEIMQRPPRPIADIARELGESESTSKGTQKDLDALVKKIAAWEKEYQSADALYDLLLDKNMALKEEEKGLEGLRPLPDSVPSADAFIRDFKQKEVFYNELKEALNELHVKRAELEGGAPDETREEIEVQWKEAERRFDQREREGDAIVEIREAFTRTKEELDARTLDPWLDELKKVVAPLSAKRYRTIAPTGKEGGYAKREDGLDIPFESLSMGTRAGLGLALRLSMARYFLQDAKGFIVLDDPLVDMDADRQKAASEVIRGFASEKQVILFTCHPHHAELLGGNTIDLSLTK